jgi:predicted aldo/keto reductase-like oxidoreductase
MSTPQSNRRNFLKTLGVAGAGLALSGQLPSAWAQEPVVSAGSVPKRKFGKHADMVSCIAVGGYHLATAPSVEESTRLAHAAIDLGINFFDNCWDYHRGKGEEWMGHAIKGKRDQVFLMTKVCSHEKGEEKGKKVGMRMLEESLKRLQTDHLDLWQVHSVGNNEEVDAAFAPEGIIEALEEAKKQGKVRYLGFTGHKDPNVHLRMLSHQYPFDAVQMPLSAMDAHEDGFQKMVLPELLKQGIAPIAMKALGGGGQPVNKGLMKAEEGIRYALSLPIVTMVSGIGNMDHLQQNAKTAMDFKPYSKEEMVALETKCAPYQKSKEFEPYLHWLVYKEGRGSMVA